MRNVFLLLGLASMLLWTPIASAATPSRLTNVVKILCGYTSYGTPVPSWMGSGVVIDDDTVLTNSHVASPAGVPSPDWCIGGIADSLNSKPAFSFLLYPTRYEMFDMLYDYAFMQAYDVHGKSHTFTTHAAITDSAPSVGDAVDILGYPGMRGPMPIHTQGSITNIVTGRWMLTDAEIRRGNSGGGAFDHAGNLIGLPTRLIPHEGALAGGIQDVHAILESAFGKQENYDAILQSLTPRETITPAIVEEDAVALYYQQSIN